jgi:hypothetical protein
VLVNLKGKELYRILGHGVQPVIEFVNAICDFDGPEPGMRAKVVGFTAERDELYTVYCDLAYYESYNQSFLKPNWIDNKGVARLNWMESSYYPKDKIFELYVGFEDDSSMKLVEA